MRGTHNGAFQGLQPTGKSATVAAIETTRLENGKIAEPWGEPITWICCSSWVRSYHLNRPSKEQRTIE